MKAKDLITQLNEADRPPRPPMRPGHGRPDIDPREFTMGGPENMPGGPVGDEGPFRGGPPGRTSMRPRGPFSPQEMSMLKDLLLLAATEAMGNDFDGKIARTMMKGEVPNPGDLQHIVDECRRIKDLPEPHQRLMQKLIEHISTAGTPSADLPPS